MSKKTMEHIEVLPNIPGVDRSRRNPDPDVDNILNKSDDVDIIGMKHEPTNEEKNQSKPNESSWSWLIIGLGLIVIVLIIIIVWYVFRENECLSTTALPQNIIRPQPQVNLGNLNNSHYPPHAPAHHPVMHPSMYQPRMPQAEKMPINSQTMHQKKMNEQQAKSPTKQELEQTLKKLSTIHADKKLKPSKRQEQTEETPFIKEEEYVEDKELDNNLSNTFYSNLQQNIDNDEIDEKEECVSEEQ